MAENVEKWRARLERVAEIIRCNHQLEVRMKPDSAGRSRYAQQCVVCGVRVGGWIAKHRVPSLAPAWDTQAEEQWHRRRTAVQVRLDQEEREADLAAWRSEHALYLHSSKWARLRDAVLKRSGGRCEGCGSNNATQVHHLHYKRWRREMLFDLVAVCRQCHLQIHEDALQSAPVMESELEEAPF